MQLDDVLRTLVDALDDDPSRFMLEASERTKNAIADAREVLGGPDTRPPAPDQS